MKRIGYYLFASMIFFACNQETIKIKGKIDGLADGSIIIKMKTNKKVGEKCLDTLQVEDSEFVFKTTDIKPPVRLTAWVNDSCDFDIYIGKYGSYQVSGKLEKLKRTEVYNDDLGSEYYAYCNRLDSAYIVPIQSKIEWVAQKKVEIENGVEISEEDESQMYDYDKSIKKAQSRRRMSIVKTVRANPASYVMMAVMQREYNSFNKRHRAEIKKIFGKRFSDTALYWQMCP